MADEERAEDELSLDELDEAAGGAEGTPNTNCAAACGNTNCVDVCGRPAV